MATNAEVFRVPEDYALTGDDGAPLDPVRSLRAAFEAARAWDPIRMRGGVAS